MKKYTHPKKNNSLVISKNGATNFTNIFNNSNFTNASFDIRDNLEIISNMNEEEIKDIEITTYINEYKFSNIYLWNKIN